MREEWKPDKNSKQVIKKLREYAANTLHKDNRINIRLSSKDLDRVQVIAAQEGIPYQPLISSIIHKYVSGYLIEKKNGLTWYSTRLCYPDSESKALGIWAQSGLALLLL